VVVCRLKNVPADDVEPLATGVREACRRLGCPFVLSHLVELVPQLKPDGLHVGKADPWRDILADPALSNLAIGYSAHSADEAESAQAAGCDYTFLGPVFHNPEKIRMGRPLGVEAVRQAAGLTKPVVFIGGINEQNIAEVTAAGGTRIAAIRALQAVPDPRAAARKLRSRLIPVS
jgi:thiamine-phosphate pyrophosphorylase